MGFEVILLLKFLNLSNFKNIFGMDEATYLKFG